MATLQDKLARLHACRAAEQRMLAEQHVLQLRSTSGEHYWQISGADCASVAWQVADGVVLRAGGFRDTIHLLMLAGF